MAIRLMRKLTRTALNLYNDIIHIKPFEDVGA